MDIYKIYKDDDKNLIAYAESRIGGRLENQDSYSYAYTKRGYVATVCDGMGGGPGGKTASQIAVKEILSGIDEAEADEDVKNVIVKAVRRANMAIIAAGDDTPALKGMGSTATVLLITERSAFVAHVGDSRVYQFRGRKKIFRTFDHSVVFEMVAQKMITEEQARLSASSNVITRALGVNPDVDVEIHELPYEKGDRFLLCTDGIHGTMPEKELIRLATMRNVNVGGVVDNIATIVDGNGRKEGGGHDNLTLAIIETKIDSKLKPKMSKKIKIAFIALIALFVISAVGNVTQFAGTATGNVNADSLKIYKDSLNNEIAVVNTQNKYLKEIQAITSDKSVEDITMNDLKKLWDSIHTISSKDVTNE